MRITGGRARGIRLRTPRGGVTRPATERLREALFSSLGSKVEGSRVADIFAGTGSYGLEALSRGAASAVFFENDPKAFECLQANVSAVLKSGGLDESAARAVNRDAYSLETSGAIFDLVFLDPPYAGLKNVLVRLFERVVRPIVSNNKAWVVLEFPGDFQPEIDGWKIVRHIGKTGKGRPAAAVFERT